MRWSRRRCELRRDSAHHWEFVPDRDEVRCSRCGVTLNGLDIIKFSRWRGDIKPRSREVFQQIQDDLALTRFFAQQK